jgi:hypothetical protein
LEGGGGPAGGRRPRLEFVRTDDPLSVLALMFDCRMPVGFGAMP